MKETGMMILIHLEEMQNTYKFNYNGGVVINANPQLFTGSFGIQGVFLNGAALYNPSGTSSIPGWVWSQYSTTISPINGTKMSNYQLNAYYFIIFLGKDLANGHPEDTGQYHYHTGNFIYNGWNTPKLYNSNSYFSGSYYTLTTNDTYLSSRPSNITTTADYMRHTDGHSKIVGFCFDGFPIYGPFGYTDPSNSSSGISRMTSSYVLRSFTSDGYYTDTSIDTNGQRPYPTSYFFDFTASETDTDSPYYENMTDTNNPYYVSNTTKYNTLYIVYEGLGRKHKYYYSPGGLTSIQLAAGCYTNDYVYQSGQTSGTDSSGNSIVYLDEYNGRWGITPEYPNGTYAYFCTFTDSTLQTVSYPYIIGNYSRNQINFITTTPTESTNIVCFKEDSLILTDKGYRPIQDLRKGDLVKTLQNGFLPIGMIGKKDIVHLASSARIKDQLYKCSQDKFEEIFEPLVLTGCHSILVDKFVSEEQRAKTIEVNKYIYITDNKYRLPACVDERTTVYEIPGTYTIYHLALENDDYYISYGIYANGLLVESCSKWSLKENCNMELID